MLTCFKSSGRTPALCIGSEANCAAPLGASNRNAAAASDASIAWSLPHLPDATTLVPHLLAHFQIFIALQHETAWAGLVLLGNIRSKAGRIAVARGYICCRPRGQTLLQRQVQGAIDRDAHHAVVLVRPSVRIQQFVLLLAIGMQLRARFHLQTRRGRE